MELLIKKDDFVRPVVAHGLENLPPFLGDEPLGEAVLPQTMAWHLNINPGDSFQLISPSHFNHLLGERPRSATLYANRLINTDVPEADSFHLWMRLNTLQNLTHQRSINKVRLYGTNMDEAIPFIEDKYRGKVSVQYWHQRHRSLLWSLSLENSVMLFLFASMTALVGLCITGGLSILYSKVKLDFAGFWILGASPKQLERANTLFLGGIFLGDCFYRLDLGSAGTHLH